MAVALHASYFRYNFGDTLLCRVFADWTSGVSGEDIVLPLADERNRRLIGAKRKGILAGLGASRLVFGGGGYFSEPREGDIDKWSRRAYWRHIVVAEAAAARSIPYAIYGVGVGPLSNPSLREKVLKVFQGAKMVVVRDNESRECLDELGFDGPVEVAVDAIATLTPAELFRAPRAPDEKLARKAPGLRPLLIHANTNPSKHEFAVIDAAARWAEGRDDVAVVMADDSVSRRPLSWPKKLLERYPKLKDRVVVQAYRGDPDDLVSLLSSVEGVVTTKLHVGIVSTVLKRQVVSVPTHSKTRRFYRQIGLAEQCLEGDWQAQLPGSLEAWANGRSVDFSGFEALSRSYSYRDALEKFLRA